MATVQEKLLTAVYEEEHTAPSKVTIVGVGQVGMACAYSIMQQVGLYILMYTSISQILSLLLNEPFLCFSYYFPFLSPCRSNFFNLFIPISE